MQRGVSRLLKRGSNQRCTVSKPFITTGYARRVFPVSDATAEDLRDWDTLHKNQFPDGNAFFSAAFAQAAAKVWPHVRACYVEDAAGLAAILPFQFSNRALGAAERVGEELNDSFGILARPDFSTHPNEILALSGCHYLYFSHLCEEQQRFGLFGFKARTGLRIELPYGGDVYWKKLASENKKFTADTERRGRKAAQEYGEMRFHMRTENSHSALQELLAHKRAQYIRTGQGDLLATPQRREMLARLVDTEAEDCQGYLSRLSFGDTWAAMHFGLRSRKTLHYWFPVYNPALNSFAPGRLLLREIIRHAQAEGIQIIDRGEGETSAKRDFPSEVRTYFSGAWHDTSPSAACFRLKQSLKWRIQAMAKMRFKSQENAAQSNT